MRFPLFTNIVRLLVNNESCKYTAWTTVGLELLRRGLLANEKKRGQKRKKEGNFILILNISPLL